jgi:hypothetical protein
LSQRKKLKKEHIWLEKKRDEEYWTGESLMFI